MQYRLFGAPLGMLEAVLGSPKVNYFLGGGYDGAEMKRIKRRQVNYFLKKTYNCHGGPAEMFARLRWFAYWSPETAMPCVVRLGIVLQQPRFASRVGSDTAISSYV